MFGVEPLGGAEDAGPAVQVRLVGGQVGESVGGLAWLKPFGKLIMNLMFFISQDIMAFV